LKKVESEVKTETNGPGGGRDTVLGSDLNRKDESAKELLPGRNATFVSIKLKSPAVKEGDDEAQFTTQDEALFEQKPA